jgi:hypothetical protein
VTVGSGSSSSREPLGEGGYVFYVGESGRCADLRNEKGRGGKGGDTQAGERLRDEMEINKGRERPSDEMEVCLEWEVNVAQASDKR